MPARSRIAAPPAAPPDPTPLRFSLLDEPLIRYRRVADGAQMQASLPALFAAMVADEVRDFPALRPHQRHPWHAFLTQLAAIALHRSGQNTPWPDAPAWRAALLDLTPEDPDGAAWCLVSPPDRPALLQPPVPGGRIDDWKSQCRTPDELDMLVTSKNHDLKGSRATSATPDSWLFALLSLQTQEGRLGNGNFGVSRMNRGYGSRPGVGVAPIAAWGRRWRHDLSNLLAQRDMIAAQNLLSAEGGLALVWLYAWDGTDSLSFSVLDPFYIEICRRVRLQEYGGRLSAKTSTSQVLRIAAKELNGRTGDAWTPINTVGGQALTISIKGFDYKLTTELLYGGKYTAAVTQEIPVADGSTQFELVTRGIARGQGETNGFHQRCVPISPKVRKLVGSGQRNRLGRLASRRVAIVGDLHELLRSALLVLLNSGKSSKKPPSSLKSRASRYAKPFEQGEDARFFDDLALEIEADDDAQAAAVLLAWQQALVERAESFLHRAFEAGPRSAMQRYHARSAALSLFHGVLRGTKSPVPDLAEHWRRQAAERDLVRQMAQNNPNPEENHVSA